MSYSDYYVLIDHNPIDFLNSINLMISYLQFTIFIILIQFND